MKTLLLAAALAAVAASVAAEEFTFDAAEFEKNPFELNGYIEPKLELLGLRGDSAAYKLAYPNEAARSTLTRSTLTLELAGKANLGDWVFDARAQASQVDDALTSRSNALAVQEGGVRYNAGPGLTLDLGKRVTRWGKGYALTTVGFVERPKDATDPTASREGFVMASVDWTRSLPGSVSAISFTGILLPTDGVTNADFGRTNDLNPAAKLYLLAWDTDIDLMWRAAGAKPQAWGLDFSRNVSSNLEVHGEWARLLDATHTTVSASGTALTTRQNATSWLLGLRYLTEGEVTWVGEWVHNGNGASDSEWADTNQFLRTATTPGAAPALLAKAQTLAASGLSRANPGQDYLYVKASVSEPLGWVYGSAAVSAMVNAQDQSWQLTPELAYTGLNGWDLRARLGWLHGADLTEYGEKLSQRKLELTARYSF
ncbi:MAG: hypothetical protein PHH58_06315 [Rhodoferax sp.]|nr:hypothetical protein [Rhodoferax sp.]